MYEDYDGDYPHDYGFDLPDNRYSFITAEGKVSVAIIRHWYHPDEDLGECDMNFKVSFNICFEHFTERNKNATLELPIGTTEDKAINIAHELYEEDAEATQSEREYQAEVEAERRMGA